MKKPEFIVVEEESKKCSAFKIIAIICGVICAVTATAIAVKLILKKKNNAHKVLAEIDIDGDGEADATMIDTNGDGEVDTIVFHEGE